jgi:hypothetical protein
MQCPGSHKTSRAPTALDPIWGQRIPGRNLRLRGVSEFPWSPLLTAAGTLGVAAIPLAGSLTADARLKRLLALYESALRVAPSSATATNLLATMDLISARRRSRLRNGWWIVIYAYASLALGLLVAGLTGAAELAASSIWVLVVNAMLGYGISLYLWNRHDNDMKKYLGSAS